MLGKRWKLPKAGKNKADTKQESIEKAVKNKEGNFLLRKAKFPNGMKDTIMETFFRTQTC